MDTNEKTFTAKDVVLVTVVVGAIGYSAYKLGKLAIDLVDEGIRALPDKTKTEK